MGQMSHGWRKKGGKDLEPRALLKRVDLSDGAGIASEQLAPSKREADQKCKPRAVWVRGGRKPIPVAVGK